MPEVHAILSASSSKRWLNCTPSARLEQNFPNESSVYAEEGTAAHRTKIFYCDPMASWQKPKVEKNHEFIRYIIPKGKSMAFLTEEKVVLLMNHINSIRRESLGGRSPWQVASEDEDMRVLMNLLNMKEIEPDNVLLTPDLLED